MRIGFIGLGNVGGKLASSLRRNDWQVWVYDLSAEAMAPLVAAGATTAATPAAVTENSNLVITCLPSPTISAAVMEGPEGILTALAPGKLWAEMSITDADEVQRLADLVAAKGGAAVDCPVSSGCHRAATGNILIFAGAERPVFERVLPVLTTLGRLVFHTGPVGSASILKVVINYLATANLVTFCEARTTVKRAGLDLNTAFEAIRISSGTSFVHETEGQVILNGSRDISFTMDLVAKDIGLFQAIADRAQVPLEISRRLIKIFDDGIARFGARAFSRRIVERLEAATGLDVRAPGFPAEIFDDEPEAPGAEVWAPGHGDR